MAEDRARPCVLPERWPELRAIKAHGERLIEELESVGGVYAVEMAVRLGLRLGIMDSARGMHGSALASHEAALRLARRELGEEHPDTLGAMSNVATTMAQAGELGAARGLHQRVLELRRAGLGERHPDTLASMSNLACACVVRANWRPRAACRNGSSSSAGTTRARSIRTR